MAEMNESFDLKSLGGLPEPVRRYFAHYLEPGAGLARGWRLRMKGLIRVGVKLPFEAEQELDGSSFTWTAKVPNARFPALQVTDFFRDGAGGMVGRMVGRQLFSDQSPDAARSAATRAVMESTMVPATLLPDTGVVWTDVSETELKFRRPAVGQAEEVTIRIDRSGRAREVEALRWHQEKNEPGSLVPFLCRFDGELDFRAFKVPERLTAGWVIRDFEPFFEARITAVEGISVP